MEDNNFNKAAVAGRDLGESSNEIIEIKIKTLDSQIYPFRVNRRMPVPALKEEVASVIGVPSEQQRLICRGKVLKDDQLLSDYHVEDGHTLHLVVRQPVHTPPSNTAGSRGSDGAPEQQGADPTAGGSRNRIGQVSHGVVLGTFNVPDQGDGGIPDLNRIIAAVLNSVGIGNLAPVNTGTGSGATMMASVLPTQVQQGSGLEGQGRQDNINARSQAVNQLQTGQVVPDFQFEPVYRAFHTPSTLQSRLFPQAMVVQDALTTLSQYLDRMQQPFSVNGFNNQPQSFTSQSTEAQDQGNASGSSTISRGLPTPAALGAVIRHTQQFLNGQAGAALSQFAEQLEGEMTVTDPTVRSQIQSAAMQNGIMMQHLGALLLELGRTTLTLSLGQSHADSVVNSGPAVYISPTGPNPIMVQPPPFQSGASFGAFPIAAVHPSAGMAVGPVGSGDVPRNISIHIHAGGTSVVPGSTAEQGSDASMQQGIGQANQVGNVTTASRGGIDGLAVPIRTVGAPVPVRPPTEATGASFGFVYPLLARFQPQGVPVRSLAVSFVNGGQSGRHGTAQQSLESIPLPTTVAQVQAEMQNVNVAMQTINSSSASLATTASASALPVQEVPQNQAEQEHLVQQGQSAEHLSSRDIDSRNGQRNDDQGNVSIAGSSEMANLVNSVFQQVIEACGRSGRAVQQSHEQQQVVTPGSVNEPTTEEQSNLNDKTVGNKRADSLENLTVDAGPSVSSVHVDGKERDMFLPSSNTIPTSNCASSERGSSDGETTVPVGLGLGGLQPLRRPSSKQNRKQQTNKLAGSGVEGGNSTALPLGGQDGQSSIARGQNVLQALASQWSANDNRTDENGLSAQLPDGLAQLFNSTGSGGQTGSRGVDVGSVISQLLHSPAVNNLLQGMSEQTGTVPPGALSNMVQQVMQSPLLINTMQNVTEQLAEQSQGLEDMLSGFGGRRGGVDFSRVLQQVMPIVSQAIGRESQAPVADLGSQTQSRTEEHRSSVEDKEAGGPNLQIDLEPTIQQLTHHDPPEDVLRTMVENAMVLYAANEGTPNGVDTADLSHQLSDTEGLANEYVDVLNRDFITRLQTDSESVDDS